MPPTPAFNSTPLGRNEMNNIPSLQSKDAKASKDVEMEIEESQKPSVQKDVSKPSPQSNPVLQNPNFKQINKGDQEMSVYQSTVRNLS